MLGSLFAAISKILPAPARLMTRSAAAYAGAIVLSVKNRMRGSKAFDRWSSSASLPFALWQCFFAQSDE